MFCHEDAAQAEELARKYMANYFLTIVKHYELMSEHFKEVKGYDFYRDAGDLFRQRGREVYREVCPMVAKHIEEHLAARDLSVGDVKRMWLHQANLGMNQLIARKLLGRDPEPHESPVILDEFANTSSAGSVIAFHRFQEDLEVGDVGVLCSFGAGYSVGSVLLRKVAI
jgi:beta-ketodecanoyl-[acyl-carrier-protein] synthase